MTPATAMVNVDHTSVTHGFQGDITPSTEQMGKTKVNLHVTFFGQLFCRTYFAVCLCHWHACLGVSAYTIGPFRHVVENQCVIMF